MKNIAILHYSSPPIVAGVELVIKDHSILMAQDGFDVTVISGRGGKFHENVKTEIIKEIDPRNPEYLKIREQLEAGKTPSNLEKYADGLYLKLQNSLKNTDILIIHQALTMHFNLALTQALIKIIKENPKMKIIHWTHDATFLDENYSRLFDKYKNKAPWNLITSKIPGVLYITISQYRQNKITDFLGINQNEIEVITNGLRLSSFLGLSAQTFKLVKKLKIFERDLVGFLPMRIVRRKNIEKAIEVAKEINIQKDFLLLITAPIDYQNPDASKYFDELKIMIKKLGLENNVVFLSVYSFSDGKKFDIDNLNLRELFLISDFLLLTSRLEGFGMPIIEAGAMKTPVFCTNIKPFLEIAGDFAYYFNPNDNSNKIAKKIIENIEKNPQNRLREKVVKEYNLEMIYNTKIKPLLE